MDLSGYYDALYVIHVGSVILSGSFFFVRGIWMLRDSPALAVRWVRTSPHVIDTLLLLSALALTVVVRQYPFQSAWLTAKVTALLFYIGFGMVAIGHGRSKAQQTLFWLLALAVYGYIVAVALTRSVSPWH